MILENIEDGYYEVDLSGTFISVNDSFLRIVGYSGEEVIGKNFSQFTDPEAAQKTYRTFHQVFLSGESIKRYEFEFFRKTGDKRYIDVSISMVKSSAGSCQGFRGIARDITDLKAAEEERRNLEARMREVQKLESLGVLAGGIAHDFNNLLMAILGNADLALYSLPPASPTRHNIEEILKVSQRAADLCRQMLAYSGKGRFVIGRYNLGEIIREMTQMLEVSISKKASLRYAIADDLPSVEVDATQMRQIIMNLITNASEALGEQNGLISLSCGAKNCDRAYLADSYLDDDLPAGSYVFLEVSDTGEGMDTETQKRLFEPFYSTKFIGRGLGLAAVLGIVRSHKGAIKVVSERGKGTSFLILLPAVDRAPLEEFSPEEQDKPIGEGGTILLVDDDAHVRQVASEMIAYMGFKVLTAVDGREGLEIFRTHLQEINGVILDLSMPKMGGEEAFREFRQLRPDLPIILSSGYNEQDVIQRFTLDGLDGYLQKPYSLSNLREVLERVLDGEKRNDLNEDQSI
jgi:PAS domain S-box-containing protein